MRIALYQPDMPQNAAALIRLAACLGLSVEVIEPCGFLWDDRRLRRVGMDYLDRVALRRHRSWEAFRTAEGLAGARRLLLTTAADQPYTAFAFRPDDVLILGRESAGVPEAVHADVNARLGIPMAAGARSLNVVVAAAMVAGEALRQTDGFKAG
jgi:tRNA (cytidine/uridine-2'-O-)-methyltransferase